MRYGRYKDIHPDARNTPLLNHYFAIRPCHGVQASIRGKLMLSELGFGKKWITAISLEYGLKSTLLGHYGRHQVGYTVLGVVDGIEHREYHFQIDNSTLLYLSPLISIGIDVKNMSTIKYGIERSFLINSVTKRQNLYINNPDGEYYLDDQVKVNDFHPFNSSLFLHSISIDVPVTDRVNVTFGHQWSVRSMLKPIYVWYPFAFPFRNFSFGVNYTLGSG